MFTCSAGSSKVNGSLLSVTLGSCASYVEIFKLFHFISLVSSKFLLIDRKTLILV